MNNNFEILEIYDKQFIFFNNTLLFFECNDQMKEVLMSCDKVDDKGFFENFTKNEKELVERFLNQVKSICEAEELTKEQLKNNDLEADQSVNKNLKGIQINSINACNLNCRYCFAGDGTHNKKNILSIKDAEKMVDYLFENSGKNKEVAITIIGGEPFLNIPVFKHVLRYAKKQSELAGKNVSFFTTTNGTIYEEELMDLLNKYNVRAMLSMDSHDQKVQDILRPTKTNLSSYELIKKNSWDFFIGKDKNAIHITITPKNLNIYDIAKDYYEAGFYCVHLDLVKSKDDEYKFNDEKLDILLKEYDKLAIYILDLVMQGRPVYCFPLMENMGNIHRRTHNLQKCGSPNDIIAFSPEGKIYPCDMLMWDDYEIGDLKSGINNERKVEVIGKVPSSLKCESCWARYLCGGECLGDRTLLDVEERKIYCKYKQHIIKLQLYIYYIISKEKPEFLEIY